MFVLKWQFFLLFNSWRLSDEDLVSVIDFLELDLNDLSSGSWQKFADIVGSYGKFTVATVDEDEKLNGVRSSQVNQAIHGSPNRSSREENIINQEDIFFGHRKVYLCLLNHMLGFQFGKIVALECDV